MSWQVSCDLQQQVCLLTKRLEAMHDVTCRDTYPNQHVGITVRALIYRWMDRDAAGVPQVLNSALGSLFFCQIGISASSTTACCCLCSEWAVCSAVPL